MIVIIKGRATPGQVNQMLEALEIYIKMAVDVDREVLAGGGELHADCELFCWMMAVSSVMFGEQTGIQLINRWALSRLSTFVPVLTIVR